VSVQHFISSFLSRKGAHVLFSFFFSKVANFLVAVVVIRLLSKSEYGSIVYAVSILSFLIPFMGAGIHQGLIRYGALSEGQLQKKYLLQQTMWPGLKASGLLVGLVLLSVPFVTQNMSDAAFYLVVLSFQLLGLMLFQFAVIYCRLLGLNRLFAKIENINNAMLVIGNITMCYFFQGPGYVISLVLIPFLLGLFFMYRLKLFQLQQTVGVEKPDLKKYISFGLSMSIGSVMAQMLFAVDILLLGNMLPDSEELVAQYKAATIFPFSLLFIPVAIISSDFVKLVRAAENDKAYLKSYYFSTFLEKIYWLFLEKTMSRCRS
jgi:O-antigen/teichoic acid export membrane protein